MNIKKSLISIALGVAVSTISIAKASQDSLGLPGDNFDLYGALDLFKKAESPEDFERAINEKNNEINNLDLNHDGEVDYIKVIDQSEGDAHAFILQATINDSVSQDVAAIEVEKNGEDDARLQIVGDTDLYGKDYIVEPADEKTADAPAVKSHTTAFVNVWGWPCVHHVYGPHYRRWVSPWRHRHYPVWFAPWPPVFWTVHFHRVHRYHHPYYHRAYAYHAPRAHKVYYGHRTSAGNRQAAIDNSHRKDVQGNRNAYNPNKKAVRPKNIDRKNTDAKRKNVVKQQRKAGKRGN